MEIVMKNFPKIHKKSPLKSSWYGGMGKKSLRFQGIGTQKTNLSSLGFSWPRALKISKVKKRHFGHSQEKIQRFSLEESWKHTPLSFSPVLENTSKDAPKQDFSKEKIHGDCQNIPPYVFCFVALKFSYVEDTQGLYEKFFPKGEQQFFSHVTLGEPLVAHWGNSPEAIKDIPSQDGEKFLKFLEKNHNQGNVLLPLGWSLGCFSQRPLEFLNLQHCPPKKGEKFIPLGGIYNEKNPYLVHQCYGMLGPQGDFLGEAPWNLMEKSLQEILPSLCLKAYGQGIYGKNLPQEDSPEDSLGSGPTLSLWIHEKEIPYEAFDIQSFSQDFQKDSPWCLMIFRQKNHYF